MRLKQPRWVQSILLYLTITNSVPGLWALCLPKHFYDHFPGFGRTWISIDGPYNEHLIRDVGAFFLALTTLCFLALINSRLISVRALAICLLVFNVPHLLYHLQHLHMLPIIDQIGNVVTLSMAVLIVIPLLFYRPAFSIAESSTHPKTRFHHE